MPRAGVEVVRGVAGGAPHMLAADPCTCQWTTRLTGRPGLADPSRARRQRHRAGRV